MAMASDNVAFYEQINSSNSLNWTYNAMESPFTSAESSTFQTGPTSTSTAVYPKESGAAKIAYTVVAVLYVIGTCWTIYALRVSKKIPYGVRFLLTGLLSFDLLYIVTHCLEKFVPQGPHYVYLVSFGYSWMVMSMLTLTLMSLDRFVAVRWPFRYERSFTPRGIQRSVTLIWFGLYVVFNISFFSACLAVHHGPILDRNCVKLAGFNIFVPIICIVVSTACFVLLIITLRTKLKFQNNIHCGVPFKKRLKQDRKAIALICIQLCFIWIELSATEVVAFAMDFSNIDPDTEYTLKSVFDAVLAVNCLIDVFVHVWWYKECRYRLVKSLMCCNKLFKDKEYSMRQKMYDIIPSKSASIDQEVALNIDKQIQGAYQQNGGIYSDSGIHIHKNESDNRNKETYTLNYGAYQQNGGVYSDIKQDSGVHVHKNESENMNKKAYTLNNGACQQSGGLYTDMQNRKDDTQNGGADKLNNGDH